MASSSTVDALFVGSVPLSTNENVFVTLSEALGSKLPYIPDGETGYVRTNFIACQYPVLPNVVLQPHWQKRAGPDQSTQDIKSTDFLPPDYHEWEGLGKEDQIIHNMKATDLNPVGYDDWAIASFATFKSLQDAGKIPAQTRFQVSLPSPFTVIQGFVEMKFRGAVEPLYEQKLLEAIRRIQAEIPHDKLCLQLDLPLEIAALEADAGSALPPLWQAWFSNVKQGLLERLTRVVKAVDQDVILGLHLCYGDINHAHWMEPNDLGVIVDFIDAVTTTLEPIHHMEYIHLPVPKSRSDAAYFEPLKQVNIPSGTKIYLGLIHANDAQGTKARLESARAAYKGPFGVSTECGLGRCAPSEVESVISIIKEFTDTT